MDDEKIKNKKESRYIVSITGKNTNFEVPINSIEDFERVDEILRVLKRKI
mgnify:CR=1 FL=1